MIVVAYVVLVLAIWGVGWWLSGYADTSDDDTDWGC